MTEWYNDIYIWYYVILTVVIVTLSVAFNNTNSDWYKSLVKPPGVPPNWVFGLVWGLLYIGILVAICFSYLANNGDSGKQLTLSLLYTLLLILTLMWIVAFTNLYMLGTSLLVMLMILFISSFLIYYTYDVIPSLVIFCLFTAWIVVATYFTAGILWLNN